MVLVWPFCVLWIWLLMLCTPQRVVGVSIREAFQQSFDDSCEKYDFVRRYQDMLEQPPDRYVVFTYQARGLRNGGFGDRMGGLVTAFAHALRFNRTLLIKASNGFQDYFRPYHSNSNGFQYTWGNTRSWSGYQEWKRQHPEYTTSNRLQWLYDLSDCVSNSEEGFTEAQTYKCAMDGGDVPQPVIHFSSNRAYLCRWENRTDLPSHREARRALRLTKRDNLFEAAGCMLRLVMWPTDLLWRDMDAVFYQQFQDSFRFIHHQQRLLPPAPSSTDSTSLSYDIPRNYTLLATPAVQIGLHFRCGDYWSYRGLTLTSSDPDSFACTVSPEDTPETIPLNNHKSQYLRAGTPRSMAQCTRFLLNQPQLLIDTDNVTTNAAWRALLHTERVAVSDGTQSDGPWQEYEVTEFAAIPLRYHRHIFDDDEHQLNKPEDPPYAARSDDAAQIGDESDASDPDRYVEDEGDDEYAFDTSLLGTATRTLLPSSSSTAVGGATDQEIPHSTIASAASFPKLTYLIYAASDNAYAAEQMRSLVYRDDVSSTDNDEDDSSLSRAYFSSPRGCHIELDPSPACYALTTQYWFLLSLSDILVVQTFGPFNAPTSSFSRYAGLYGLRGGGGGGPGGSDEEDGEVQDEEDLTEEDNESSDGSRKRAEITRGSRNESRKERKPRKRSRRPSGDVKGSRAKEQMTNANTNRAKRHRQVSQFSSHIFRSGGRGCQEQVFDVHAMSRVAQGNWFCA